MPRTRKSASSSQSAKSQPVDPTGGTSVGKHSLVDQTFGAPASTEGVTSGGAPVPTAATSSKRRQGDDFPDRDRNSKRLRDSGERDADDAEENADGIGEGGDEAGASNGPPSGFPYRIAPRAIGTVAPGDLAAQHNTAQFPPTGGEKRKGQAYVGAVLTVGQGKDKGPAAIAAQYADEAFDSPADASTRFALVVGVNRMDSVLDDVTNQRAALAAQVATITQVQGFPATAFHQLWRPGWVHTGDGAGAANTPADIEDVRTAAAGHSSLAREAEASVNKADIVPVGPMRTTVLRQTRAHVAALEERHDNVYVHVGDGDAVSLKAKPTADAPAERGLFDRYDDVIAGAQARNQGEAPWLVSGGYRFRVDNRFLPEGERHDDPHAGSAGRVTPQTAQTAELSMRVRQGQASVNPYVPYLPEPNLLIHSSKSQLDTTTFGDGNNEESRRLSDSIMGRKPSAEEARRRVVFDTSAALYTDGGRFDRDTVKGAPGAARGETTVPGLFNGPQATSDRRTIVKDTWQKTMATQFDGKVFEVAKVYMPRDLLAARLGPQAESMTPAQMQPYLAQFTAAVEAIDQAMHKALDMASATANDAEVAQQLEALPAIQLAQVSKAVFHDPAVLRAEIIAYAASLRTRRSKEATRLGELELDRDKKQDPEKWRVDRTQRTRLEAAFKRDARPRTEVEATQRVKDLLAICKATAIEIAAFLQKFQPQAAQPEPEAAPPPLQAPAPAPAPTPDPNAMDTSSP